METGSMTVQSKGMKKVKRRIYHDIVLKELVEWFLGRKNKGLGQ